MDISTLAYLVSALLAVIILVDVSVLWLTGKQVPEQLSQLVVAVFATYFASGLSRSMTASKPGSKAASRGGRGADSTAADEPR